MLHIPYGKERLTCSFEPDAILTSRIDELRSDKSGSDLVRAAMDSPIASPRLCELAKGKATATIIISDHTRPVPSKDILPHMLAELRQGSPEIAITLLVATGFHRGTTRDELVAKLNANK